MKERKTTKAKPKGGKKRKSSGQFRHWCVTSWPENPDEDVGVISQEFEASMDTANHGGHVRFACFQVEQGETGKPHVQGYVEFHRPRRMSEVKNVLGSARVHLENRRGSRSQAMEYASKEEGRLTAPVFFGEWRKDKSSGARTMSDRCIDLVLEGLHPCEVAKEDPQAFFSHARKVWDLWAALNMTDYSDFQKQFGN